MPKKRNSKKKKITWEDGSFWEVEAIINDRIFNDERQYLVKWIGWDDSGNTWEPIKNLSNVNHLIAQYNDMRNGTLLESENYYQPYKSNLNGENNKESENLEKGSEINEDTSFVEDEEYVFRGSYETDEIIKILNLYKCNEDNNIYANIEWALEKTIGSKPGNSLINIDLLKKKRIHQLLLLDYFESRLYGPSNYKLN